MGDSILDVLVISFLAVSSILLLILVLISVSFLGLYISELGLWFSWIPLGLIIAAIPFLVGYSAEPQPSMNFFLLLVSTIFNTATFFRILIPFLMIYHTNRKFRRTMKQSLGMDYLLYIDPSITSRFFRDVRFKLSHYFSGVREKHLLNNVNVKENVTFRVINKTTLKLDVCSPKKKGNYPIIVFIHGGGWMKGSKDKGTNERVAMLLASYGYVVFNIDYRLSPTEIIHDPLKPHEHPTIREMVTDVRSAMKFALENGASYGGDTENLFLFGRSAGAHLALLTAYSLDEPFYNDGQDNFTLENSPITSVIAFYPITDLKELHEFYDDINPLRVALLSGTGGKLEENVNLYKLFSPIEYVHKDTACCLPPVFLVAGKYDRIVDVYQSEELSEELTKFDIPNVYLEFPWANHAFDLILAGPGGQLAIKYMTQFLVWSISRKKLKEIEQIAQEVGLHDVVSTEKMKRLHQMKNKRTDEILAELSNLVEPNVIE